MGKVTYAALGTVGIEFLIIGLLRAHYIAELAGRGAGVDALRVELKVDR